MSAKYALVIGNTDYADPGLAQLTAPGKDAEDFARVLQDTEIGAFDDVVVLLNQAEYVVREAIDDFFNQKMPDDLLVLYFSGHGVRDELGALYLAVKNTVRSKLRATGIKSDYIREAMDQSRSRRQVLVLDCCNSGAFAQGTKAELGGSVGTKVAFEGGYGRVILTASDSTQLAWEGDKVIGETDKSLFTHFLVEGLEGEADLDGDGRITVDELYDYTYEKVKHATPKQTPSKFSIKEQGEIVLRHSMPVENIKPVALQGDLLDEIEDTRPYVREAAVQKLEKILKGRNIGLARSAREALAKIATDDDSRKVSQAALQVLESFKLVEAKAEAERKAKEDADRLASPEVGEERLIREMTDVERKTIEEKVVAAELKVAQKGELNPAKKGVKRFVTLKKKNDRLSRERTENDQVVTQKTEEKKFVIEKAEHQVKEEGKSKIKKLKESKTQNSWDTRYNTLLFTLEGHTELVGEMAFAPDGQTLASGSDDATIRLWNVGDGTLIRILNHDRPEDWVSSIAFSPGGQLLATSSSRNNTVYLWRVSNGILVRTFFEEDILGVNVITYSPDATTLATGSTDNIVRLWRISDGALTQTLTEKGSFLQGLTRKPEGVNAVIFSPNGKMLASGSNDGRVRLWDIKDGTLFKILKGHTDSVLSVAFAPSGEILASGSADSTIRLWDVNDGALLQTLDGHTPWFDSVIFSSDGKTLASRSGDDLIRLWRASDGKLIRTFKGPTGASSFAFSPKGQILAYGSSEDGRIFLLGSAQ